MEQIFLEKLPANQLGISAATPVDDICKEIFDGFKIGQKFEIIPWRERNFGYHKKLFSLISLVVNRNPNWKAPYFLLKLIQLDIGSVDIGLDFEGKVKQFPKSISFKSMSHIQFDRLFNDVANHLLRNLDILIPGMSEAEMQEQIQRILLYV